MSNEHRELHDEIVKACSRVADARIHFRDPDVPKLPGAHLPRRRIDRDLLICSLLNKAANTHRAVRTLCDSGMSNDAMSLSRVLFETSAILRWLLRSDKWVARVDLYGLYAAAIDKQTGEALKKHLPDVSAAIGMSGPPSDLESVADDVFSKRPKSWPRVEDGETWKPLTFQQVFEEFEDEAQSFSYEYVFARLSGFVHSSVSSITTEMRGHQGREYAIRYAPRGEHADEAIALSNAFMVMALISVEDRVGLGLSEELVRFVQRLRDGPAKLSGTRSET